MNRIMICMISVFLVLSSSLFSAEVRSKKVGEYLISYDVDNDNNLTWIRVSKGGGIILEYKSQKGDNAGPQIYVDRTIGCSVTVNFFKDREFSDFSLVFEDHVQMIIWDLKEKSVRIDRRESPPAPF